MSLYGSMRTAVSGMNAQSTRLATVADNIANSGTNGYKRASVEFSSLVIPNTGTNYVSGGVSTQVRYAISQAGPLQYTTSVFDLAAKGNGFFIVGDSNGSPNLTRAGSFVPDANGNLVNAAGFKLMGYDYANGIPSPVANGYAGLVPVKLENGTMTAVASTQASLKVNLPYGAEEQDIIVSETFPPSSNSPYSTYTERTSFGHEDGYDQIVGDIYYTKLDDNMWEVTAFGRMAWWPDTFPYAPIPSMMASTILTLDPASGAIVGGNPILTVSTGSKTLSIDLTDVTQLDTPPATPGFRLSTNLPSDYSILGPGAGYVLPSENEPASTAQIKQTITGYTGLGSPIAVDSYYVKTGPNTWEASFFNSADMTGPPPGFPYGNAGDSPLATTTLTFDPITGDLVSGSSLTIALGGGDTFEIDYSDMQSLDESDPAWAGNMGTVRVSLNLNPSAPSIQPILLSNGASPAGNQPTATYTSKTSLTAYDHVGNQLLLDVYFTKGPDDEWEVAVFNQADASPNGSFPYGSPGSAPLAMMLVQFEPTTGRLIDEAMLTVPIPNGENLTLDLSSLTQLAADFTVLDLDVNGSGPATVSGYSVSVDGVLYVQYENGQMTPLYRLPLATVQSPDQMAVLPGNVFQPGINSGDVQIGFANEGGLGSIVSGALESSNVDIAEELTNMIKSQRNYTANSKVFQTGSDLMDVLVNLKR